MSNSTHFFRIAELNISITFMESKFNSMALLPSFKNFSTQPTDDVFFNLTVHKNLSFDNNQSKERIRDFDTGNGITVVDRLPDGGYEFTIGDIHGQDCCRLKANHGFTRCECALRGNYNMRSFGLNNALMLIFSFAGSYKNLILIHASLVRHKDHGYAFTAKSGTGKSTHVSMWLRHIPGCDLMNDDNPIVRIIDGKPYIYGTPWSGKTPCYRNIKAHLGTIAKINRATENHVQKLHPIEAFAALLPSASSMKWDKEIFDNTCGIITRIIESTPIYTIHCLPNKEAAIICHQEIAK